MQQQKRRAGPAVPGIPRHRLLLDRGARWLATAGGIAVIAVVLGIMLFLLAEAWPLLRSARLSEPAAQLVPQEHFGAVAMDEHRTHVAALGSDGVLRVMRADDGSLVAARALAAPAGSAETPRAGDAALPVLERVLPGAVDSIFRLTTRDGRLLAARVVWRVSFAGRQRVVTPVVEDPLDLLLDPERRPIRAAALVIDGAESTAVAQLADGQLVELRREIDDNPFTGERSEEVRRTALSVDRRLRHLEIDPTRRFLYASGERGGLLWWDLGDGVSGPRETVETGGAPVTALSLLAGGRSLAVGHADGSISVWFRVRYTELVERLTRIHELPSLRAAVALLAPAQRDRTFLALDVDGGLGLFFSTSERLLARAEAPIAGVEAAAIAPKGDALLLAGAGRVAEVPLDARHPEAGLGVYFGKVWYEGFPEPGYTWQSTGGTSDFESKLSLVPLVFGTLKGAFYSLLLAVPLGILGAIYASQFMHPKLLRVVKPTIELMASLPSVVLGFVAGLWLAPRMEESFPAFLAMPVVLPIFFLAGGLSWSRLPRRVRARVPDGSEVAWFAVLAVAGFWLCFQIGPFLGGALFEGSFQNWLYGTTGLRYDQRNALVVGIAMGFAVIPIIFSIAEDAFSNVPRNLIAGSLALGASRWETVVRVVLPTASPGVFSAVMVGLGRAVGETMIVLMATGNTPILDWSIFNGFRTLAANIAVEIPEAPHGGTLYRTLFLTALLLFALTFLINSVAEIVRSRLRHRYARL